MSSTVGGGSQVGNQARGRASKRDAVDADELEKRVRIAELRAREAEAELRLLEANERRKSMKTTKRERKTATTTS